MATEETGQVDQMEKQANEEMLAAGVPNEQQLRETKPLWPETALELTEYIRSLVERPHSYGTCVYAMSLAAGAALNYVAKVLGCTGFQVSCADMEILRHTRNFKRGRILNYDDLLYPQYCTEEKFPSLETLLKQNRLELAEMAKAKLAEAPDAHPNVVLHWQKLIAKGSEETP